MEKFQVPQFIEQEDKIVGPFTLKQFFYIAVAGGILFFLFFYVRLGVWLVFLGIFGSIAISLAFIKINGHSLSKYLYLGFRFYWNPQLYLWKKEIPSMQKIQPIPTTKIHREPRQQAEVNTPSRKIESAPQRKIQRTYSSASQIPRPQFGKIKGLWQQLLTSKGRMVRERSYERAGAVIKAPGGGHISAKRVDYS